MKQWSFFSVFPSWWSCHSIVLSIRICSHSCTNVCTLRKHTHTEMVVKSSDVCLTNGPNPKIFSLLSSKTRKGILTFYFVQNQSVAKRSTFKTRILRWTTMWFRFSSCLAVPVIQNKQIFLPIQPFPPKNIRKEGPGSKSLNHPLKSSRVKVQWIELKLTTIRFWLILMLSLLCHSCIKWVQFCSCNKSRCNFMPNWAPKLHCTA